MKTVDVAVIGAGSAGLSAIKEIKKSTNNFVLIDDGPLGTTCARVGCMPSKIFIQAANDIETANALHEIGVSIKGIHVDQPRLMNYVRKLRDHFVASVLKGMDKYRATNFIAGRARFIDAATLSVNKDTIRAKKIIIATGSKPVIPDSFKSFSEKLLTTDNFFEQTSLPKSLAVLGMGVIGTELGLALKKLGVDVVAFDRNQHFGGLSDPKLTKCAAEIFEKQIPIHYGDVTVTNNADDGLRVAVKENKFDVEKALVSFGRRPALENLGLETLSLDFDNRGIPIYDPTTLRIGDMPIYLAGDVTGRRPILHEAADEGRIAGFNAVQSKDHCFRRRQLLLITFSEPQIAIVGTSYQQLIDSKIEFLTGAVSFFNQGRSTIMRSAHGFAHIYAEKTSGKLLGAEMIGPHSEHLAHLLSWVTSLGLSVHDVLRLPFYHPVVEEGLRTAFRDIAQHVESKSKTHELIFCNDVPAGA